MTISHIAIKQQDSLHSSPKNIVFLVECYQQKSAQSHKIMSPIYYHFHSTNFSQTINPLQLFKVCKQVSETPRTPLQFKLVNVLSPSIKFQLFRFHKESRAFSP